MMKNVFLTLLLLVLVTSCSSKVDLAIDNPTETPVVVKIDTLEVEIPARQVVWVEMGKGEHQVTLENDSIVKFNFQKSFYMLNPTLREYLITKEFYGSSSYAHIADAVGAANKKKVNFLGVDFEGNYSVVRDLINPVTWDYGPRETLPEMIQMESGENYTFISKMYDELEFVELMRQNQPSEGSE